MIRTLEVIGIAIGILYVLILLAIVIKIYHG